MKRMSGMVLVLLMILMSGMELYAQVGVNKGIKGGLNVATIRYDDTGDVTKSSKIGFNGGVFVELDFLGPVNAQAEVLFTQKGVKEEFPGDAFFPAFESTSSVNYLEIPVLGKLGIPMAPLVTLNLYGGPAFAFKLSENVEVDGQDLDLDEDVFESSDVGAAFGGALNISAIAAGLVIDIRYTLGLKNIVKNTTDGEDFKNGVLSVSAGLSL